MRRRGSNTQQKSWTQLFSATEQQYFRATGKRRWKHSLAGSYWKSIVRSGPWPYVYLWSHLTRRDPFHWIIKKNLWIDAGAAAAAGRTRAEHPQRTSQRGEKNVLYMWVWKTVKMRLSCISQLLFFLCVRACAFLDDGRQVQVLLTASSDDKSKAKTDLFSL